MVRLHGLEVPSHIATALRLLEERGAWERRQHLSTILKRDFAWFVRHFDLKDEIGDPILRGGPPYTNPGIPRRGRRVSSGG